MTVLKRYTGSAWEVVGAPQSGTTVHKNVSKQDASLTLTATNTNWTAVNSTSFDLAIAAAVGDVIAVAINARIAGGGTNYVYLDVVSIVSGTFTNLWSDVTYAAGSGGGIGSLVTPNNFQGGISCYQPHTVVSGDLSGGVVTLRPVYRFNASGGSDAILFATTSSGTFSFMAVNLGPVAP